MSDSVPRLPAAGRAKGKDVRFAAAGRFAATARAGILADCPHFADAQPAAQAGVFSFWTMFDKARFIVVEGSVGTGKHALAKRLAEYLDARPLLGNFNNPFFSRFCQQRDRWALQTQLAFLFARIDLINQYDPRVRTVADFLLDRDMLFAELTLPEDELALYQHIFQNIRPKNVVSPDLVVYLEASPEMLLSRIRQYSPESDRMYITESYLNDLTERYAKFFYQYDASPIFTIDMDRFDPIGNDEDFELLLRHLKNMRGYREYLGYSG